MNTQLGITKKTYIYLISQNKTKKLQFEKMNYYNIDYIHVFYIPTG